MVIFNQATFIGYSLYVTCYAGHLREGPGPMWETSIYITGAQAVWWDNTKSYGQPRHVWQSEGLGKGSQTGAGR